MIRRLDGDAFVAPSVQERALEDHSEALGFVARLESGEFDLVICMTGAGLAFLRDIVAAHMPVERLAAAMDDPHIVLRVDRNADGHAEQALVRQRLRPERIDLEDRNLHHRLLRGRGAVRHGLAGQEADDTHLQRMAGLAGRIGDKSRTRLDRSAGRVREASLNRASNRPRLRRRKPEALADSTSAITVAISPGASWAIVLTLLRSS